VCDWLGEILLGMTAFRRSRIANHVLNNGQSVQTLLLDCFDICDRRAAYVVSVDTCFIECDMWSIGNCVLLRKPNFVVCTAVILHTKEIALNSSWQELC
jgi:hypothetical protein